MARADRVYDRAAFGERLRVAIADSVLSQAAVARCLRVSPNRVSEWVHGRAVPNVDQLARLASMLSADLHWLVTGQQRPAPEVAIIRELASVAPALRQLADRAEWAADQRET